MRHFLLRIASQNKDVRKPLTEALMKEAGFSAEDFFDNVEDSGPTALQSFEKEAGGQAEMIDPRDFLEQTNLTRQLNRKVYFIRPQKAWFVDAEVSSPEALKISKELFSALIPRKRLPAATPAFHDKPLWISLITGEVQKFEPPQSKPKQPSESSTLKYKITQLGKSVFGATGFSLTGHAGKYTMRFKPTLAKNRGKFREGIISVESLEEAEVKLNEIIAKFED